MMNWKAQIRLVRRVFAATALAFLIASAILFGLVQTNWGIKELARWVSGPDVELTFVPDRISGVFPFRFELEHLSIADRRGVWLEARGIRVHWAPSRLIQGQILFTQLVANSVNLDRTPFSTEENAEPLPSWIFALRSDRFTIDRLSVGNELLGEQAILKLDARIPSSSPDQDLEAFLRIERMDRVGSLLEASVAVQVEPRSLKMEISFHEDGHGLLGKALGVEGPLSLSLSGQGSPDLWQGKFLAGALPFGRLAADLEVKHAVNPLIKLRGRLQPELETMPSILRIWMSRELPFELETRLHWPRAFIVERAAVQADKLDLVFNGSVDLNQRSSLGQFSLTCRDLNPLSELLELPTAGKLVSQGTFSTREKRLHFSVTGSAENFQVGDSERVLGKNFSWEFGGDGSPTEVLSIRQMKISAENLLLEGTGGMKIPEGEATMDALFEIKDLRSPSALEFLAGWSTQGKAHLSWNAASGALSGGLQGKLQPPPGVIPPFLAKELHYSGTLSLENATLLNLSRFEMAAPWGTLQGDAKIDLPQESLKGTWQLLLQDLELLSPSLKGGPLEIRGKAQGPVKSLTLSADATARDLSVSELHFDIVHASLQAVIGSLTQGSIRVDAQEKELALRGQTNFDLSDRRLNLTNILLEGGKSRLAGHLSLSLAKPVVEGELKAECNDLTALSPLIHEKIHGRAVLQGRLFPSDEGQKVSLLMDARDVEVRSGKALRSRIEAHGTLSKTVPRGRFALEIQDGVIGDLSLPSSALILEGDLGNANFQLTAEGCYRDPFEISSSGLLTISVAEKSLTVNHLEGRYGGTSFSLLQPATVARSSERINIGEWLFKLGSGQIQGSGYIRSKDLSLDLWFEGVPLQLIPVQEIQPLGGLARGNARLSGSPASPEGTATLQIETLRLPDPGLPAVDLTVHAALADKRVRSTFLIRRLSETPLTGDLEGPLHFSLWPLVLNFPTDGEMRGSLKGEMPLEKMAGLVGLREDKLAGMVELDLGLEGPWEKPRITGWLHLKKGAYENLRTGTILRDVEADIAARTPLLLVNKASATDGEKGRLSAQGQFEFSPGQGFPFKLDLVLEKMKPFRYDWASAVIGGDLTLAGSLSEALLSGRIQVDTAEFRIPERLAPEIQNLEVIEINKPGATQQAPVEVRTLRLWPLSLDLILLSPGRVFLSGRGLESEWQGEIRVKGEATKPSVEGVLSVVRGSVSLFGKRFELKKGSLLLDGTSPPSPWIDVEAESKSREIVATLRLSGPVESLEMKLSSDPPLPPDEILSRLLFGRSASNITPLQAVQLADSLNTLTRGGGLDLLARTRQLLNLDQLTFKQSGKTQEETALSAGKYLSEKVYIEVEQGISPETGKAALKWEISPSVTVETEVGVNAEAGVGINWRWDY